MTDQLAFSSEGKAIELAGVSKAWGDSVAVEDLSISVPAGSFAVLLGPSGCGKSTTLRMIAGLESVDSGRVTIGGRDVTGLPSAERDIAMVFQSYALFPHLSVAENIIFGLRVRRVSREEREARLNRVAELLGLSQLLDRKPAQLSGGQQQRVALGRAIIAEKPVCLMDEPLSNLDAKLRHEMRVEIRALQRRLGFTMVYVTHDQVEAITMADQVVLLDRGRLVQAASPKQIYGRPKTPFAARFIGTPPMNVLPAACFAADGKDLGDLMVGLRPEALTPSPDGAIEAEVTSVEYLGADALVDCLLAGERLQVRIPGAETAAAGEMLRLSFALEDLHLFDRASGARRDALVAEIGPCLRS